MNIAIAVVIIIVIVVLFYVITKNKSSTGNQSGGSSNNSNKPDADGYISVPVFNDPSDGLFIMNDNAACENSSIGTGHNICCFTTLENAEKTCDSLTDCVGLFASSPTQGYYYSNCSGYGLLSGIPIDSMQNKNQNVTNTFYFKPSKTIYDVNNNDKPLSSGYYATAVYSEWKDPADNLVCSNDTCQFDATQVLAECIATTGCIGFVNDYSNYENGLLVSKPLTKTTDGSHPHATYYSRTDLSSS